jgi:formamidopyrimidine-DNA glycosylase
MPELPDVTVYVDAIAARIVGHRLERLTITSPFLLRSFEPSPQELAGRVVGEVRKLGKRIAIGVEGEPWLVLHLMIAGRLHWYAAGNARKRRAALATFDFDNGSLTLTEAGTKRRASLYVVAGAPALGAHDPAVPRSPTRLPRSRRAHHRGESHAWAHSPTRAS